MRLVPALAFTLAPMGLLGLLGDLDRLREILRRAQELIMLGGVALALLGSLIFILTWALSHVRRPLDHSRPWLSRLVLLLAWIPVLLTGVAAVGLFVPGLAPFILKAFALAIAVGAIVWCLAVGLLIAGGSRRDLGRGRKALILAGTPWYCLVVYLATFL